MLFLLVFLEVFLLSFGEECVVQEAANVTYMHYPHFHFAGRFRADTATLNNFPNFFDIRNFTQSDARRSPDNWNPLGSGEWTVEAEVTHVCYCDYRCVGNHKEDSLCGTRIAGGGTRVPAKLVDLDPQAHKFSEVWGWRILVGEYFSADYVPAPFQYRWVKSTNGSDGDTEQGAAGQSLLTNIKWNDTAEEIPNSPILQKMRKATRLSIRFNMDAFNEVPHNPYFGWGRITGTIGLAGNETIPFTPGQRLLKAQFDGLQDAPFILNKEAKRLTIDFGNSLPITKNGSHNVTFIDQLMVAIAKNKTDDTPVSCHDNLTTLGIVLYRLQNWYQTSGGVQSFPPIGVLSQDEIDRLKDTPLIIAEVEGTWPVVQCKRILFSEAKNGIQVHPYTPWVLKAEPGDEVEISLLATRFGTPAPGVEIHITPFVCDKIFYEYGGPRIGTEPLPFPAKNLTTNESGLVSIQFRAQDPKKQREFIDGQLYPYLFWDQGNPLDANKTCAENHLDLLKSYIVIRVFDSFTYEDPPTWRKDVYPIFKQYSLLYPVMTLNYVDLGNYYEVTQHLDHIKMTLRLPRTHPNHMPVTRDLSKDKLNMILKWLDCPLEGKEEEDFTIEELRRNLQTAMEVEHSTIPTYLTALATIKKNYNNEVQAIFKQIILQEMLHLALAANLLNAVGGKPTLFSENFIPLYPSRLPGGLVPTLQVPIVKCSISLIADIFMAIEQPSLTLDTADPDLGSKIDSHEYIIQGGDQSHHGIKVTGKYTSDEDTALKRTGKKCDITPLVDILSGPTYPDEPAYRKHYNTIGEFYEYILDAFSFLTQNGTNQTIFSGNESSQLFFNFSFGRYGKLIKVTDFKSAKEAIQEIIREGEGSSPCNPLDWSNKTGDLSHYFLFKSIVEQHKINVHIADSGGGNGTKPPSKTSCQGEYHFNGSKIFFDPAGVWPMVNNPRYIKYTPGSRPDVLNKEFNRIYTNLLRSLEVVFNGHPEKFVDALGLMMTVDRYLKRLVQTPLEEQGDPTVGPNAGPTFEFRPD